MIDATHDLKRRPGPFGLALTDRAFDGSTLQLLEDLFEREQRWARHQDHFYRCFIAEVDGQLPGEILQTLRGAVSEVLELDLYDLVRVTAQRMEASDGSDRHTDRPLAGYESARLVVQLDGGRGGHFRAFDGDQIWLDRAPQPNGAVAFELSADSHHDVTACVDARRTVVFHFWDAANPPHARHALDGLLGTMSFAELPAALDMFMSHAEASRPEELTHLAASVAYLLHRWGLGDRAVVDGYQRVIGTQPAEPHEALARWLVQLHIEGFDRQTWERLQRGQRWLEVLASCRPMAR